MKRIVGLVLLSFLVIPQAYPQGMVFRRPITSAGGVGSVPSHVASSGNTANTGTTISTALACTSPDAMLVAVHFHNSTTVTISSFSDSTGNSWTASPGSPVRLTSQGTNSWIYRLGACATATHTVTITFSATITLADICLTEVSGFASAPSIIAETSATHDGSSSAVDPGSASFSPAKTNAFIYETSRVDAATNSGTGYTRACGGGDNNQNETQYKVVSAGTWGASAFTFDNNQWIAQGIALAD